MPERAILVVVAVRDPGLRSLLAAELSVVGVELLTATHYLQVPAQAREPGIAVVDLSDMEPEPAMWLEALAAEKRWPRLAIVGDEATDTATGGWPVRVLRRNASQVLRDILENFSDFCALPVE